MYVTGLKNGQYKIDLLPINTVCKMLLRGINLHAVTGRDKCLLNFSLTDCNPVKAGIY